MVHTWLGCLLRLYVLHALSKRQLLAFNVASIVLRVSNYLDILSWRDQRPHLCQQALQSQGSRGSFRWAVRSRWGTFIHEPSNSERRSKMARKVNPTTVWFPSATSEDNHSHAMYRVILGGNRKQMLYFCWETHGMLMSTKSSSWTTRWGSMKKCGVEGLTCYCVNENKEPQPLLRFPCHIRMIEQLHNLGVTSYKRFPVRKKPASCGWSFTTIIVITEKRIPVCDIISHKSELSRFFWIKCINRKERKTAS